MTEDQIQSIITALDQDTEYFVWQVNNATPDMTDDIRAQAYYESVLVEDVINGDEDYEKIIALMEHTGDNWDEAESVIDSGFKVFTDEEADAEFTKYKDNYLNDVVLSQIPTEYHTYFDSEQFIDDNLDDRGSALNRYDGCEDSQTINGTVYYIYKQ